MINYFEIKDDKIIIYYADSGLYKLFDKLGLDYVNNKSKNEITIKVSKSDFKESKNTGELEEGHNNGGSTDYYKLLGMSDLQDIIEARNMNFAQGNILKAAFCFNVGRHEGTSYERELNKIIYFAKRELERIKKG